MSKIHVQFFDDTQTAIVAVFGGPQDEVSYPNQGEVEADDERYIAFTTPESTRVGRWLAIKAERDRRTETGGFKVGVKWFHSDQKSRSQQLGLNLLALQVLSGGGTSTTPLPGVTPWKTMDGTEVVMTAGLAQQILVAGAASDSAIFDAAKAHKTAMEASTDPAAYDFSTGWPAAFGE